MIIPDFEDYEIFEDGRVHSWKTVKFLKPQNNGNGYLKVHLYKNGKMYQRYIHKLVALYFVENPNNYKYVDHIDRNKDNNHASNLRWCSASENSSNTGGISRYSQSKAGFKHYSEDTKQAIRDDFKDGLKVMEIAEKYNIPRQSVSRFIKYIDSIK
jgi:Mor family transcriptional regulator